MSESGMMVDPCVDPQVIPPPRVDCARADGVLTETVILEGVVRVEGAIRIGGTALTNLDFMACVQEVTGDVTIFDNDQLTSLDGLWSLTEVGGGIAFSQNDGLIGWTSYGAEVGLGSNPLLCQSSVVAVFACIVEPCRRPKGHAARGAVTPRAPCWYRGWWRRRSPATMDPPSTMASSSFPPALPHGELAEARRAALLRGRRHTHRRVLVAGDCLQNWRRTGRYFSLVGKLMMRSMGFIKPHNLGPGWVKAAKPKAAELRAILELELEHVLPAHGEAVLGGAKEKYRAVIEGYGGA